MLSSPRCACSCKLTESLNGGETVFSAIVLDLDGTVYRGSEAIPGVAEFVRRAAAHRIRCLFVTNRANRTPEEIAAQISSFSIPCAPTDVLTSAQAAATFIETQSGAAGSAHVLGGPGLRTALEQRGIRITDESPEYVVVGYDPDFTYRKLTVACRLILAGARYIATNPDRIITTENGILPGTGAIVAAVAEATRVAPLMIGKPEPLIMETAAERLGLRPDQVLAVGDNLETDIPAGARAGMKTALILTGVSTRADLARAETQPDWVVADYDELERLLGF
ncbi:MAG: HAD family hydrolase [Spirochaetaceae bacterium]|nr:MAG: HAD family hydrolase [Spirochaetaceae bacterium]